MPSTLDLTCLHFESSMPGYRFHEIFGRVLCSPSVYSDPQVPGEVDRNMFAHFLRTYWGCMALRVVSRSSSRMFLRLYSLPLKRRHAKLRVQCRPTTPHARKVNKSAQSLSTKASLNLGIFTRRRHEPECRRASLLDLRVS